MLTDGGAASSAGAGWQLNFAGAGAGSSVERTDTTLTRNAVTTGTLATRGKNEGKAKQSRLGIDDQVMTAIARLTLQGLHQHRT